MPASYTETYLHLLALPPQPLDDTHPLVRALDRAHDNRKLELEFYWQRSSYSWTLQGAAFAALALAFKDGRIEEPALLLPITIFGAITALAARLTAAGSKFWQENWEIHVDLLEEQVEGRLAQTVNVRDRVSFSVSKVNERLLTFFLTGWIGAFLLVAAVIVAPGLVAQSAATARWWQVIPAALGLALGCAMLRLGTVSGLKGCEWSDGNDHPERTPRARDAHGRAVPLRYRLGLGGTAGKPWLIQRRRVK